MPVAKCRWLARHGHTALQHMTTTHGTLKARRFLSTSFTLRAQKVTPKAKKAAYKPLPYTPPSKKVPLPQLPTSSGVAGNSSRTASWRKYALIGLGIPVLAASAYMSSLYVSWTRESGDERNSNIPADVSDRYNLIANKFDASVDSMESTIGINKLRKKMAAQASGDVCEVSIGTGRNLSYYDWDFKGFNGVGKIGARNIIKRGRVKSFTAVDKSQQMLEVAHNKFSQEFPGILGIRWVIQDASEPLPAPPVSANEQSGNKTGKKYDTIVQTMGLCSTPDPVALLRNLGDSIEPDGRILLLEHGRSTWDWINKLLDAQAPKHADQFGCWWNKDIGKIVEDSGLEIVQFKRKHFGTTYWIELKPSTKKVEVLEAASKHVNKVEQSVKAAAAPVVEPSNSTIAPTTKSKWW